MPSAGRAVSLQCPSCGQPLRWSDAQVVCPGCTRAWPLTAGVACLGHAPDYPVGLPDEQLAEALAIAERSGWQAALHDYLRPLDNQLYRRAVDEYRAQWRCLVPRHPEARLLDLRCGWGPIAVNLAPDYGLVIAADTRYELARFTALRAEAAGLGHLAPVCLDPAQSLPFSAGFFDVVVLHEVLEWGDLPHLLREVHRVLAPGGQVFLNAGNRLNVAQMLASVQQRLSGQGPAAAPGRPARPHTLPGYRRALRAAGLAPEADFGVLPSATEPFFIVPLASRGGLKYFLDGLFQNPSLRRALSQRNMLAVYQTAQAAWRLARFLPVETIVRQMMPGYGLLASKPR